METRPWLQQSGSAADALAGPLQSLEGRVLRATSSASPPAPLKTPIHHHPNPASFSYLKPKSPSLLRARNPNFQDGESAEAPGTSCSQPWQMPAPGQSRGQQRYLASVLQWDCLTPSTPWALRRIRSLCPMNYLFPAQQFYSPIQTHSGSRVWGEQMPADGKRKRLKKN